MKKILTISVLLMLQINISIPQVNTDWISSYNSQTISPPTEYSPMAIDTNGNVYVAGYKTVSALDEDYILIKYNSIGVQQWVSPYNGTGNSYDRCLSITASNSGNVYVTGYSVGVNGNKDYLTIKYNSTGNLIWSRRYNGLGNGDDYAYSIAIDDSQNVYVTGFSIGLNTDFDYLTIKYNSNGDAKWIKRYNDPGNLNDYANNVLVDKSGNVIVTGTSYGVTTIKYNPSGDTLWVRHCASDTPSMSIDDSENVYVTGTGYSNGADFVITKYDKIGNEKWVVIFGGGGNQYPLSIAVDKSGNSFVTGPSESNFLTVKYDNNGVLKWSNYSSQSGRASSITVDKYGNSYVCGSNSSVDYFTVKYNSTGSLKWTKLYDGVLHRSDKAYKILLNPSGNKIYVSGFEGTGGNDYKITTIQYSIVSSNVMLNLKLLIEGLYNFTFDELNRKDTVKIFLRNINSPYSLVDSSISTIDSISCSGIFRFINALPGSYYIVVKHFNSIETWSKFGGELMSNVDTTNYNFTVNSSQAYGNNLKFKGERYTIYSGNTNQDAIIDASDISEVDNDAFNSLSGYVRTDLTGDYIVDAQDLSIVDNNAYTSVLVIRP